jgi:branched-chain amino acid aminotransferase
MDGQRLEWDDATVHVLAHGLNHGTGAFEGLRAYPTSHGVAVFRLDEHLARLERSASQLGMRLPHAADVLREATLEVVAGVGEETCYVRILAFRGEGQLGLDPAAVPVRVAIAAWPGAPGFGPHVRERGLRLGVSRWVRPDVDMVPLGVKATGPYLTIAMSRSEAVAAGYDDALVLNRRGTVAEATIMNVAALSGECIISPPERDGPLPGITLDTLLHLARDAGLVVERRSLTVDELQQADAVLCTGTAAEVVPVAVVADVPVGTLTCRAAMELVAAYAECVRGRCGNERWCSALAPDRSGARA